MRRNTPALVMATALMTLYALRSQAVEPTPTAPPAVQSPSATPGAVTARPPTRMAEHVWWRQPGLITALELTDAQRKKMDQLLEQALDRQRAAQDKQPETRKQFTAALARGDWKSARKLATKLREEVGDAFGVQPTLKVDVMSLLDTHQRDILSKQHAHLLQRPWIGGMPARRRSVRTVPPPSKK